MFTDYLKIRFSSGSGGRGSSHFCRQLFAPKGGPDGGNGGRGGNIIIKGNENIKSLYHIKNIKHIKAGNGDNGSGGISTGKNGDDFILEVPIGTEFSQVEGDFLFSIDKHLEERILLEGGMGGLGNVNFKSSTNQIPKFSQSGMKGSDIYCVLDLKIVSDFALIGKPNSGKTSILRAITNSKAKVSDYDFTTTSPNIGIMESKDGFRRIKIIDLPAIIEGSSIGKGLGFRFIKHIEYANNILVVIPADSDKIISEYNIILKEIKSIKDDLVKKNIILVISKIDKIASKKISYIKKKLVESNIFFIFTSFIEKRGIMKLKRYIFGL